MLDHVCMYVWLRRSMLLYDGNRESWWFVCLRLRLTYSMVTGWRLER